MTCPIITRADAEAMARHVERDMDDLHLFVMQEPDGDPDDGPMTPYTPGTRVVLRIPSPCVAVVRCLTIGGMVVVDAGDESATVSPGDLMPAMPRNQADIDKYGRYWWRGDKVGEFGDSRNYFFYAHGFDAVNPSDDWRGPVGSPPEVRS